MFKFNFNDIEDIEDLPQENNSEITQQSQNTTDSELEPFKDHSLNQLLDLLPSKISYSPLSIPLPTCRKSVTIIRRDLFDARFQIISESGHDNHDELGELESLSLDDDHSLKRTHEQALEFLDNPSDLVPGKYEGGLKTWECSLDLVLYLDSLKDQSNYHGFAGKNILELGCGTAIPSLYVLQELLLSSSIDRTKRTVIHLQDYNAYTLHLVTIANILLTWYASPQSSAYRASIDDPDIAPLIDPTLPGELTITPELKQALMTSLQTLNISLNFFSGSWHAFHPQISLSSTYDVVLTAETIYQLGSLSSLINLMRTACTRSPVPIRISDKLAVAHEHTNDDGGGDYLCLVASKVLYFGVGGGIADFVEAVGKIGGNALTVYDRKIGVGRKVMRIRWQ